jgi:hypothetical protein
VRVAGMTGAVGSGGDTGDGGRSETGSVNFGTPPFHPEFYHSKSRHVDNVLHPYDGLPARCYRSEPTYGKTFVRIPCGSIRATYPERGVSTHVPGGGINASQSATGRPRSVPSSAAIGPP